MVTEERWSAAQSYEREYWAETAREIARGAGDDLSWYEWRANRLLEELAALEYPFGRPDEMKVLEIGSGPVGLIKYFPSAERVAVDPLEDFYSEIEELSHLRDPAVEYRASPGEELPCPDSSIDLVVMENCIDHVRSPNEVMQEIRRVLRSTGGLYLTVNCRTRVGYWVHRFLSRLRVDEGHPHTFTTGRARRLIREHGFEPLSLDIGSFWEALVEDLHCPSLRSRLKAALGVSEFLVSLIARYGAADW